MISEVKIKVGPRQDQYLVLSLTVLDMLQDAELRLDLPAEQARQKRRKRDKVRLYWRDTQGGRSYLMVGNEPARELVDKLMLVRTADAFGDYSYEWTAQES